MHCTAVRTRPASANSATLESSDSTPLLQTANTTRTLVPRRHFVFSEIEVTLLAGLAAAPLATPLHRSLNQPQPLEART